MMVKTVGVTILKMAQLTKFKANLKNAEEKEDF